jgi:hypothetical protein
MSFGQSKLSFGEIIFCYIEGVEQNFLGNGFIMHVCVMNRGYGAFVFPDECVTAHLILLHSLHETLFQF